MNYQESEANVDAVSNQGAMAVSERRSGGRAVAVDVTVVEEEAAEGAAHRTADERHKNKPQ